MTHLAAQWERLSPAARALVAALSIALLSAAVFAPTVRHEFVWDDHEQVVNNKHLRRWESLPEFWRKDILALSREGEDVHSNYYRPLFYTQLLLYYQAFGPDPIAWHALAIAHNALAGIAAYLLLLEIGLGVAIAWAAAALFTIHPAHGESVSWVAAAFNDPPAATLLLLSLTAHVRWLRTRRLLFAGLGALGYAAALLLKESALSGLLLVPLVGAFVARGIARSSPLDPAARETEASDLVQSGPNVAGRRGTRGTAWTNDLTGIAPYLAVTVAYFVARKIAIGTAFGVYHGTRPLGEILPTLPLIALFYIRLLVWPFGLSPSYPLRILPGWSHPAAWASLVAIAVIGAVLVWLTRRRPIPRLALLWVAFSIWPVFNIRSFRPTYLVHQRYLYLAALGLCLAVAWGLARIRSARLRAFALAALLATWAASDLIYDRYWATDVVLWSRIAEVDPKNPAAFDWLGAKAMREGRNDEAESLFRKAIAADPDSPFGYKNLATLVHTRRRRPNDALPLYGKAIAGLRERLPAQKETLLDALRNYGACLAEVGRTDEALAATLEAAETPPYPRDAALNAAALLVHTNRLPRAAEVMRNALARHPDDSELLLRLGELHLLMGDASAALPYAEALARKEPDSAAARDLALRVRRALSSGALPAR